MSSETSREDPARDSISPVDPFSADWRVLLPTPAGGTYSTLLLLGGTPAVASLLVELGYARRVVVEMPCEPPVDAAVRLSGADASMTDVLRCMRADSALYWELDPIAGPLVGSSLTTVRNWLRRRGFGGWAAYRATPNFRDAETYRPVGASNVDRWLLQRKERGSGFRIPLTGRPRPRYAFTAVRGILQRDAAASPGILRALRAGLFPSATRLLVVRRRGRRDRRRRLVVFAFSKSDLQPVGVLKISRTAEDRTRIETEQRVLVSIRKLIERRMQSCLPQPLGVFEAGTALVGAETCLDGKRRAIGRTERQRQLEVAASWIAEFHRQTEVSRQPWSLSDSEKWITIPIAEYRRKFGAGPQEDRLFETLLAHGRRLQGKPLPLVWRHGDFNESNIFFAPSGLQVLDWEAARVGLPLFDLLYFAANWIYRTEKLTSGADRMRRLREVLVERREDDTSRVVWRAIGEYLRHLDVDTGFVPLLIALHAMAWDSREEVLAIAQGRDRTREETA